MNSNINNMTKETQIKRVQKYPLDIKYIETPSLEVQLAAVQQDGHAIYYIENPSLEVQLAAVQRYGRAIKFIANPSLAIQLAAIKQDGSAIEFIKNPSVAVQLAAVQENGYAIHYIKDPSKDIVITAILKLITQQLYYYAIELIEEYEHNNWPELDIIKRSLRADKLLENDPTLSSDENQLVMVKKDKFDVQYIQHPSIEVQTYILDNHPFLFPYMKNVSHDIIVKYKNTILRQILLDIKKDFTSDAIFTITFLKKYKINWPELDIIKTSLRADKLIK